MQRVAVGRADLARGGRACGRDQIERPDKITFIGSFLKRDRGWARLGGGAHVYDQRTLSAKISVADFDLHGTWGRIGGTVQGHRSAAGGSGRQESQNIAEQVGPVIDTGAERD